MIFTPEGCDALISAFYSAGSVYAIMGDSEKSSEYIPVSLFFDMPHAEV